MRSCVILGKILGLLKSGLNYCGFSLKEAISGRAGSLRGTAEREATRSLLLVAQHWLVCSTFLGMRSSLVVANPLLNLHPVEEFFGLEEEFCFHGRLVMPVFLPVGPFGFRGRFK